MNPVSFIAIGDWGKNTALQQKTASLLHRLPKDAVLALGDNFYNVGVASISDPLWDTVYRDVFYPTTPWFPVLGNHDYVSSPRAQTAYSDVFPLWCFPNRYYDKIFHYGSLPSDGVHLIAIDTFDLCPAESINMSPFMDVGAVLASLDTNQQLLWIRTTLATSPMKHKIVIGHYPLFSSGVGHGSQPQLIRLLQPIFDKYGVDVYLSGHDHCLDYQHHGRTSYIVSGTGCMISDTTNPLFSGRSGVCRIECSINGMIIQMISHDGDVFFQHTSAAK